MSTGNDGTTPPGHALRAQREAAKLSQVDLSRLAGCSDRYVRLLEAGRVPQRSRVLVDVLRVLSVPPNSGGALAGVSAKTDVTASGHAD